MNSSQILIYLALKFNGNWNDIYSYLHLHEPLNEEEAKSYLSKMKSQAISIFDEAYPSALKTIQRPPFVLFYHGDISLIKEKSKMISVVGSREYSKYGEEITKKFVSELAKDFVIVSGMARGIDAIAHRACIEAGGKTVCVLGCGINICYPVRNLDIYDEAKKHHLVISEYPDLFQPTVSSFPIRNRIIAGLSDCLLIPEGKITSGTSITATIASDNGNAVCCVPTRLGEDSLCNYLIKHGASLIESVDDIFYEIGYRRADPIFEK